MEDKDLKWLISVQKNNEGWEKSEWPSLLDIEDNQQEL